MTAFDKILAGGDLRSIGNSNKVVSAINNQQSFDELFQYLYHSDRKVVMRTADAIEKITRKKPAYLTLHKVDIINLCDSARDIELKWHLALLVSRLILTKKEVRKVFQTLANWATDKKESKIVRVNSLQGLNNLVANNQELTKDFHLLMAKIEGENIPSINARIRKLKQEKR
jgi:hypothetical protein